MTTRFEAIQELARRGKLPAQMQPVYEEAKRRGLLPDAPAPINIDFGQPVETVRSEIAKLPESEREGALRMWADDFVRREREGNRGIGQAVTDTVRNLARGTLVGEFLDEGTAKTQGALHSITGGVMGSPEDEALAYQRATDRAIDTEFPGASTAAKLVGGVASYLPIVGPAATLAGRVAQGVGIGGAHGAVAGFGAGEGDVGNRAESASRGAQLGAMLGGALPVAGAAATRGVGAAVEAVAPTLARWRHGPDAAADTILANRMRSAGTAPQDVGQELAEGQRAAQFGPNSRANLPEMMADTSDDLQRLTGSVYRAGGEAGNMVRDALTSRQRGPRNPFAPVQGEPRGQRADILDAFDRALGVRTAGSAHRTEQRLIATMRRQADQLYTQARNASEPFDLQPALDAMALKIQQYPPPFAARLTRALNLFTQPIPNRHGRMPVDNITRFDNAKKALDDMIERSEGNLRRELTDFKNSLFSRVHEPDQATGQIRNPIYQQARDTYVGGSRQREAIELGRAALRENSEVTADQFRAMDAAQQRMFRIGLRAGLRERLARTRPGNDTTLLFQEPRVQEILQEVIPQSRSGGVFADRQQRFGEVLARQERMVGTRNTVLGGSPTARNQNDDLNLASQTLGQLYNRFRSSPSLTNMAFEAVATTLQRVLAFRQDVALALARRLLETDPQRQAAFLQQIQGRMGPDRFAQFAEALDAIGNRLTAVASRNLAGIEEEGGAR